MRAANPGLFRKCRSVCAPQSGDCHQFPPLELAGCTWLYPVCPTGYAPPFTLPVAARQEVATLSAMLRRATRPRFYALLLASAALSQAAKLPLKIYTAADGLSHNSVNRIVRDGRGYLWFCTSEGLSRFDGYEFHNYGQSDGLPHRNVYDLLETRNGGFWI